MAEVEIKRWGTGAVLFKCEATSLREAVAAAVAAGAHLTGANLWGANLWGANLWGANLWGADLTGATLARADLTRADLTRAHLARADLTGADLTGAHLARADLTGATMPDGRPWETYRLDPLAGICDEPEARDRAIAAWGEHTWQSCPMHAAHGWSRLTDAPEEKRRDVAAFVALFDARLLDKPAAPDKAAE